MTLVEVVVATAVTAAIALAALATLGAAGGSASLAGAQASAHADGERVVALLAQEVRCSGLGAPGALTATPTGLQRGAPLDRVEYAACLGWEAGPPVRLRWSPRRVVAFEADKREVPGNGVDDDGDLLVDEGRVTLRLAGQAGEPLAVLCVDVGRFEVALDPGPDRGGPTLAVAVTIERLIAAAVRDEAARARARTGQGGRVTHVARAVVPLLD